MREDATSDEEGDFTERPRYYARGIATFASGMASLPLGRNSARFARRPRRGALAPRNRCAYTLFNAADAADVEALTSQIVPSDATPGRPRSRRHLFHRPRVWVRFSPIGARAFSMASRNSRRRAEPDVRMRNVLPSCPLRARSNSCAPSTPRRSSNRRGCSRCVECSRVRSTAATATGAGWKLIGFEDQHVFEPPFGYYDRDYPGFTPQTEKRS